MAQQIKDLPLSLLWFESLLQHGFYPWSRNFCMLWLWQKKKKKKKADLEFFLGVIRGKKRRKKRNIG